MRVSEAPIPPGGDQRPLARLGQIGEKGLIVFRENLRTGRNLQRNILSSRTRSVRAHAAFAVSGLEVLLIAEIDQSVEVRDALDPDIAALAAITTIRSTELNELLTPEG